MNFDLSRISGSSSPGLDTLSFCPWRPSSARGPGDRLRQATSRPPRALVDFTRLNLTRWKARKIEKPERLGELMKMWRRRAGELGLPLSSAILRARLPSTSDTGEVGTIHHAAKHARLPSHHIGIRPHSGLRHRRASLLILLPLPGGRLAGPHLRLAPGMRVADIAAGPARQRVDRYLAPAWAPGCWYAPGCP